MALDGFGAAAAITTISLAIADLHVELVAGAAAWTAGWWLLREPKVHQPRGPLGRPRR